MTKYIILGILILLAFITGNIHISYNEPKVNADQKAAIYLDNGREVYKGYEIGTDIVCYFMYYNNSTLSCVHTGIVNK